MSLIEALILGLAQGLTEFLPVSSSGHLAILEQLMGVEHGGGPAFVLIAHLGTLLAVLIVFRSRVAELTLYGLLDGWRAGRAGGLRHAWLDAEPGRLIVCVCIATIPAVIAALAFEEKLEAAFDSPRAIGFALLLTAAILFVAQWRMNRGSGDIAIPGLRAALLIGAAQALALMPGVSRSGSTIVAAILLGLRRDRAFEFSFLMAIPAIIGATIFEFGDLTAIQGSDVGAALLLFVVSFVSGWAALRILRVVVVQGRLGWFGVYCLAVGVATATLL